LSNSGRPSRLFSSGVVPGFLRRIALLKSLLQRLDGFLGMVGEGLDFGLAVNDLVAVWPNTIVALALREPAYLAGFAARLTVPSRKPESHEQVLERRRRLSSGKV
jgi:hypothetical protein